MYGSLSDALLGVPLSRQPPEPGVSATQPIAAPLGEKSNTQTDKPNTRYFLRSQVPRQYLPAQPTGPKVLAAQPLAAPLGEIPFSPRSQPPPQNLPNLPVPIPTAAYLSLAAFPAVPLQSPQHLLLVLDLNGTLLHRRHASPNYTARPFLAEFLAYCFANHSLLIWSSATPSNVKIICGNLFQPEQRSALLGEWGRDTLDLTAEQYITKIQVYKRLDRIWEHPILSATHPLAHQGHRWCQQNTLLIDDSAMKASAQPHNLVQIPEFFKGLRDKSKSKRSRTKVSRFTLEQVVEYLEEARRWGDVSAFSRGKPFKVNSEWGWDQKIMNPVMAATEAARLASGGKDEDVQEQDEDSDEDEDPWGGVRLD